MLFRGNTRPLWFRALNAIPVILVCGIIGFEITVYLSESRDQVGLTVVFSISAFLVIWTYLKTVWTCPGVVVLDSQQAQHNSSYCNDCQRVKPPHYHHCKVCSTCIKKMDHHCPWVGNCVGERNRKYFYQFLIWTLVATGQILADGGLTSLFKSFRVGGYVAVSRIAALSVFLAVLVLASMQTYLLLIGMTSVELVKSLDNTVDSSVRPKSCCENWCDVMGNRVIDWIFPTTPPDTSRSSDYRPVGVEMTV